MKTADKIREIEKKQHFQSDWFEEALQEMAEWKDEQYKVREEGLRETINALDARLQKANESGMYYFDQCNIQKQQLIDKACEWLKDNEYGFETADEAIIAFKKAMKGEI